MRLASLRGEFNWGILVITDRESTEQIPEWSSSEEQVTATETALAMRVQDMYEGEVSIGVYTDEDEASGALVFDGSISIPSGVLKVSDVEGNFQVELPVGPGVHSLAIYADAHVEASQVSLVVK